jgi:hypothetical protein
MPTPPNSRGFDPQAAKIGRWMLWLTAATLALAVAALVVSILALSRI